MITIEPYTDNKIEEWNCFVENSKNGIFMFNRNFMEYHKDRFKDFSMMFYDDEDLVAVMPASIHDNEVRSHGGLTYGGMITNDKMKQHKMNDCFEALIDYLKENNVKGLIYKTMPIFYHNIFAQEDLYPLWRRGAKIVRRGISTTVDLDNQLKMPKGRKAQISRAKREGVVIEESKDFDKFIELENEVLSKHHGTTAVHTGKELELLNSRFPNGVKLYVAKKDNELIAGTVLFVYKNVVHTQYMASSEVGREIGGLDLLISTLINEYKGSKKYFDFGISTEQNDEVFNQGLCAQKEGFGGRTTAYDIYELEIV